MKCGWAIIKRSKWGKQNFLSSLMKCGFIHVCRVLPFGSFYISVQVKKKVLNFSLSVFQIFWKRERALFCNRNSNCFILKRKWIGTERVLHVSLFFSFARLLASLTMRVFARFTQSICTRKWGRIFYSRQMYKMCAIAAYWK